MIFEASQEQRAFAEAVADTLERFEAHREPTDSDDDQREALWREIRDEVGLLNVIVPEWHGGDGGTWKDIAVAIEELAARPAVGGLGPLFAGLAVLLDSDLPKATEAVRDVVAGDSVVLPSWLFGDRAWQSVGDGTVRPGGRIEPHFFDGDDPGQVLLVSPTSRGVRALIPVRHAGFIELWLTERFDPIPADRMQSIDPGVAVVAIPDGDLRADPIFSGCPRTAIAYARCVSGILGAVEAVGSSSALLDRTIEYLKIREQFGQVLASMQGLQFMAADLYRKIEPLSFAAVAALDDRERLREPRQGVLGEVMEGATSDVRVLKAGEDDALETLDELRELTSAAKLAADELHASAALEAIQMHGAIGFSWELGLHRHFKRALLNRATGGDGAAYERFLAPRIRAGRTLLSARPGGGADAELRREVRDWLAENADEAPRALAALEPMLYEHDAEEQRWIERLREGRWLCLSWPEEYGGRGLSPLQCIAVNEEFAAAGVPRLSLGIGESLVAPAILEHGTDEQKARLLPRILSGEDVYCQGFSEPEHGSDLAHLQTRAEATDDGLVLNGSKIWQSAAHIANRIFVLCRTNPDVAPHDGLTYLLADMTDNGVTVEPIRMMTGFSGYNQTTFENARVSPDDVIGGINNGWKVAMTTLGSERAGEITTQYLGHLRELNHLIARLEETRRIDAVEADLVPLWIEVANMKYNGLRVVEQMRCGASPDGLLGIDKINWSEYHVRFGLEAVRTVGLRSLVRPAGDDAELPHLQRVLLESPGRRISRGTNQIQRRIIAQRILGMPR